MKVNQNQKDKIAADFAAALLWLYRSPESESSIVKGVPMHLVPAVKKLIQAIHPNRTLAVRYRGPRTRGGYNGQSTCLKADATSAAIYFQQHWDRSAQKWSF